MSAVKNPHRTSSPTFAIFFCLLIVILIALPTFFIIKQSNESTTGWKLSSVPGAPKNLTVAVVDESETDQGEYISFSTNTGAQSVLSVFTDPLCPACSDFDQRNATTITTLVENGTINFRVHPLAFLDERHGTDYSKNTVSALKIIAEANQADVAWRFYHAMWGDNQPGAITRSKDIPTVTDLAQSARELGATEEVVSSIEAMNTEGGKTMNEHNSKALQETTGKVSTPSVFINGDHQDDQGDEALKTLNDEKDKLEPMQGGERSTGVLKHK